jgi:cyclopropane fatty-acyl-phospholipid synthase-like methyltransferase
VTRSEDSVDYRAAPHYDRVTEGWRLLLGEELHYGVFHTGAEPLGEATAALTARMVQAARFAPDDEVLDVGCGIGSQACEIARDFGVRVLGITTSQVGVSAATARASAGGLSDRARFLLADGTDNGLPDDSFDRVWALESSHLMADRQKFVAECVRVLRPGGRFVLCDIIRRREIPFLEVRNRRDEFQLLRRVFGDARMESLEVYRNLMEAAGLTVDEEEDLTAATLPTFERWRANAAEHRTEVQALLGAEDHDAFVRSTEVLESFWSDGTLGYGIIAGSRPN